MRALLIFLWIFFMIWLYFIFLEWNFRQVIQACSNIKEQKY